MFSCRLGLIRKLVRRKLAHTTYLLRNSAPHILHLFTCSFAPYSLSLPTVPLQIRRTSWWMRLDSPYHQLSSAKFTISKRLSKVCSTVVADWFFSALPIQNLFHIIPPNSFIWLTDFLECYGAHLLRYMRLHDFAFSYEHLHPHSTPPHIKTSFLALWQL